MAQQRILVKLSGEALLQEDHSHGIDGSALDAIVASIKDLHSRDVAVAIVVGGGNFWRGKTQAHKSLPSAPADHIGMLATLMNGIALQEAFRAAAIPAKVLNAFPCGNFAETYSWEVANQSLDSGTIVIFSGGTAQPFFTTDTAAAVRACQIDASLVIKATKVDGVYDKDPMKDDSAKKFSRLTYTEALANNLKVMDATSMALLRENNIPLRVVNFEATSLWEALEQDLGTLVT